MYTAPLPLSNSFNLIERLVSLGPAHVVHAQVFLCHYR